MGPFRPAYPSARPLKVPAMFDALLLTKTKDGRTEAAITALEEGQ